jgi:hypothetical protein
MNILQAWHQKWPKKWLSVHIILYLTEKKEEVSSQPATQYQQGRRTATQQQLAALPNVLSIEHVERCVRWCMFIELFILNERGSSHLYIIQETGES